MRLLGASPRSDEEPLRSNPTPTIRPPNSKAESKAKDAAQDPALRPTTSAEQAPTRRRSNATTTTPIRASSASEPAIRPNPTLPTSARSEPRKHARAVALTRRGPSGSETRSHERSEQGLEARGAARYHLSSRVLPNATKAAPQRQEDARDSPGALTTWGRAKRRPERSESARRGTPCDAPTRRWPTIRAEARRTKDQTHRVPT